MAVLYRCKAPTDLVCRCGKVARRLRAMGIEYDEVRVPFLKRDRPEVSELTGQRWVPVLVHGEDVVADSHRIVEYLENLESAATERLDSAAPPRVKADPPRGASLPRAALPKAVAGRTAKASPLRSVMRSSRTEPKR